MYPLVAVGLRQPESARASAGTGPAVAGGDGPAPGIDGAPVRLRAEV